MQLLNQKKEIKHLQSTMQKFWGLQVLLEFDKI